MGSVAAAAWAVGSKYEEIPVTGHPSGLAVVPGGQRFLAQQPTVLKLREKIFSWSGDDFSVKDVMRPAVVPDPRLGHVAAPEAADDRCGGRPRGRLPEETSQ